MVPAALACICADIYIYLYYGLRDRLRPIPLVRPVQLGSAHHLTFSEAPAPLPTLPLFIMTIPNSKFQFLPPSSSQFATKLHPPAEGDEAIVGQGGCKNIYKAGWVGGSPQITIDYRHIECKCMFA